MKQIEKGSRVRFTGKFLRNTGQIASNEGRKIFTVLEIINSFLVVDELLDSSYFTPEELAEDPTLKYRRIAAGNVQTVK